MLHDSALHKFTITFTLILQWDLSAVGLLLYDPQLVLEEDYNERCVNRPYICACCIRFLSCSIPECVRFMTYNV